MPDLMVNGDVLKSLKCIRNDTRLKQLRFSVVCSRFRSLFSHPLIRTVRLHTKTSHRTLKQRGMCVTKHGLNSLTHSYRIIFPFSIRKSFRYIDGDELVCVAVYACASEQMTVCPHTKASNVYTQPQRSERESVRTFRFFFLFEV